MSLVAGLNSSTQSLSCVILDLDNEEIVYRDSVNFGEALRDKYGVVNGFMDNGAGWVHSPPLMWVAALDELLKRLAANFDRVGEIQTLAGAGQQHGTVYLNRSARNALKGLDAKLPLVRQLSGIFSRETSPIWRDSSTGEDCQALAEIHGGRMAVAERTGSVPTRRFSGPQIHKFARTESPAYQATSDIGLVSSFMASLLIGELAPIDHGDGAGMNLMDIQRMQWLDDAFGPGEASKELLEKLPGQPVPSMTVIGNISPYYTARYEFSADCKVLAFSGDNPDSLLGMGVYEPGSMVMSFGTSDTNFCMIPQAAHDPNGFANVFGAVTGGYMALSCFANAALTREAIRDRFKLDWDEFEKILRDTTAGNDDRLMIPFLAPEITPATDRPREEYFDGLSADDREGCVRGVVEGQFLNMFHHSAWMGERPTAIRATGKASENRAILQVCADVFNATVHEFEVTDSVSLGAAFRAANATDSQWSWLRLTDTFCRTTGQPVMPTGAAAYEVLKQKFAERIIE